MVRLLIHPGGWQRLEAEIRAIDRDVAALSLDENGRLVGAAGKPADGGGPEAVWFGTDVLRHAQGKLYLDYLGAQDSVRWLQTLHAGLDNPVYDRLLAKGIRISNSSAQAIAVAEYVMANVLAVSQPIDAQRRAQAAGQWRAIPFQELSGGTWLLVGLGNIGREIAARAAAFGVRVVAVRRSGAQLAGVDEVGTLADLPRLLPAADVIVLCCSLSEETKRMADAGFFAQVKQAAVLVNIGRGGLLDEQALLDGLEQERPGTAILDVFDTEPLPAESALWAHPKVRLTAHCSNAGSGTAGRGDRLFLDNLARYLTGEKLINEVVNN